MCHISNMSNMWHNHFQSFLSCVCVYMWLEMVLHLRSLCFSKRCILGEGEESVSVAFHTEFLFPWNAPGKPCVMLGYFVIAFFFFMALQGLILQRQMFRWCTNERVKWLQKENLMKLGANVTCQITDVFITALSMWLPRQDLCFLWWWKTH